MAYFQTEAIRQILVAEKCAAEKVAEARKRKARRIKEARDEAKADIEKFRQEREKIFKEFESKHLGFQEGEAARIDKDTEIHIRQMNRHVNINKEKVIQELISLAVDVVPEVHPNYFAVNPRK